MDVFTQEQIETLSLSQTMRKSFNQLKENKPLSLCSTVRGKVLYLMKFGESEEKLILESLTTETQS